MAIGWALCMVASSKLFPLYLPDQSSDILCYPVANVMGHPPMSWESLAVPTQGYLASEANLSCVLYCFADFWIFLQLNISSQQAPQELLSYKHF